MLVLIDPFFKKEGEREKHGSISRTVSLREFPPDTDIYKTPPDYLVENADNLEQKACRIRTNKQGFIIGENTVNKEPADIIFFGGSTTECLYVDEDKRFPYLVGEQLGLTVFNGGKGGSNTIHSTINLLTKGIPLEPKMAIYMHNVNDLVALTKAGGYWDAPETRAIIKEQKKPSNRLGKRISNVFKSLKDLLIPNIYKKLKTIKNRKNNKAEVDEWQQYRNREVEIDLPAIEEKFDQAISGFVELARANNIEPVLMTQFNRFHPEDRYTNRSYSANSNNQQIPYLTFCTYYKAFNEKIRAIAEREKILLIDLDVQIPPNNTYIYDSVHLNEKGSELVANTIVKSLQNIFTDRSGE